MDFNFYDFFGRFDVYFGGYMFKEMRRIKGIFVYFKRVGIVDEFFFL